MFLSRLYKAIADRRMIAVLGALDDRTLEDVGLSRWEISEAIRTGRTR